MKKSLIAASAIVGVALIVTLILSFMKPEVEFGIQYCESNADCVREPSCCDCGLGRYINSEYLQPKTCDEECDCVSEESVGLCLNNTCEAVAKAEGTCGDHLVGETFDQDGETCTCELGGNTVCGTEEDRLSKEEANQQLDAYYDSVDYSCTTDADCMKKDVHNCCGEYPQCVNKDSEVRPETVSSLCEVADRMAVCGFPTINGCRCVQGRCEGIV
ncbi:MAG: hypothetical protein ACOC32_04005 [Nanoarchaeota archaeon]